MIRDDDERRVLPRWRKSGTTIATRELRPTTVRNRAGLADEVGFAEKIEHWRAHPGLHSAGDVLASAIVLGRYDEASEAAHFVLFVSHESSGPLRRVARRVLGFDELGDDCPPSSQLTTERERAAGGVRQKRAQLRSFARDPLSWVDLARDYAVLGQAEKSAKAMNVAVNLAGDNRFVLRSATRLHAHLGDPATGAELLRRAPQIRQDPWLLAAEIAASSVMGRTSRLIKRGRELLRSSQLESFAVSELAAAIGTVELTAGNSRKARRLFEQALIDPTENAVAQVRWASRILPTLQLAETHLRVPRSFEARAWRSFLDLQWGDSVHESSQWLEDEPFSGRPAILASFVLSVALQRYQAAAEVAHEALTSNSGDPTLLNNLTFALASQGDVESAVTVFAGIRESGLATDDRVVWLATNGLLAFRQARTEEGRALYAAAAELARKCGDRSREAMALIFLAREERVAATERWPEAERRALERASRLDDAAVKAALSNLTGQKNR